MDCDRKVRYRSKLAGERAAMKSMKRGVADALRLYWCKFHKCWHMTSQPLRRAKTEEERFSVQVSDYKRGVTPMESK